MKFLCPSDCVPERKWINYALQVLQGSSGLPRPQEHFSVDKLYMLGAMHLVYWALEKEKISFTDRKNVVIREKIASQHNKLRISELDSIAEAFNDTEVRFLTIKGMAAQSHLYQSKGIVRPMVDIDILVEKKHFLEAVENFKNLGFRCTADKATMTSSVVNQVSLTKDIGSARCQIDLHKLFHNWPLLSSLPKECFRQNHTSLEIACPCVDKVQATTWEFGNRAKDFYEGDMRSLIDLRMYIHSMSSAEFADLIRLINRLSMRNIAAITAFQLQHWIGKTDNISDTRELALINNANRFMRPLLKRFAINSKVRITATPQFWTFLRLHMGFWPDIRLLTSAVLALSSYGMFKLKNWLRKTLAF